MLKKGRDEMFLPFSMEADPGRPAFLYMFSYPWYPVLQE